MKKEHREGRAEALRQRKQRVAAQYAVYAAGIVALERDPDSKEAQTLLRNINMGLGSLWDFLRDHPDWSMRLRAKIDQLKKQQQLEEEKARLKQEQKRKWRSPTLRLPKSVRDT